MASRLILSGLRSIEECLRHNPGRIAKLLIPEGKLPPRIEMIRSQAQKQGISIERNPKIDPDEPVLAVMRDYQYADFHMVLNELRVQIADGKRPIALALDGVTDPHNLGAILRTAAFMGVSLVVLPKDRSASINETVYRISSGGLEHLRVCQIGNLVSALKEFKEAGFWSVGFSEHADQSISELRRDFSPVLVIGNEEKGIRQLVRENCDFLVKIPGKGRLQSLNASVAASLAMGWACELI